MTPKQRDDAFEPLVRMRWQSGAVQRGADCADADIIAAFAERKLTTAERSRWEAHFAGCRYCTAVLGATARSGGEPAQPETSRARWWMIPITGTIVAAGIAALFLHLQSLNQSLPARAVTAEYAKTDELAAADKERMAKIQARPPEPLPSAPPAPAMNEPIAREGQARPAAPGIAEAPEAMQKSSAGTVPRAKGDQRASSIAEHAIANGGSPFAGPAGKKESFGAAAGVAGTIVENSVANSARPSSGARDEAARDVANSTIELRSSDGSTEWRIGSRGSIARLTAANWVAQASGVDSDLSAGSALSSNVCWVVGREGVILRTTDGEHWEKLASPIKGDFIAVDADSGTSAIVTASDGRRFATTDGGVTWRSL